jgi:hypothetical protein
MHPAALPPEQLAPQCDVARTRRGGPGGQHRNKVETAIVITHRPTGATGQASERRSQGENLAVAWQRLRVELALTIRTSVALDQPLSDLWLSRVRGGKLHVSPAHADFAPLLAEALDMLAALDWDVSAAAAHAGISASQLVKFLQLEPRAIEQLNKAREERGLKKLR